RSPAAATPCSSRFSSCRRTSASGCAARRVSWPPSLPATATMIAPPPWSYSPSLPYPPRAPRRSRRSLTRDCRHSPARPSSCKRQRRRCWRARRPALLRLDGAPMAAAAAHARADRYGLYDICRLSHNTRFTRRNLRGLPMAKKRDDGVAAQPADRQPPTHPDVMPLANHEYLRKSAKQTQEDLAIALGVGQDTISRLEKRSDMLLSTLRHYVECVGGHLTLVATFPNHPPVIIDHHGDKSGAHKKRGRKPVERST